MRHDRRDSRVVSCGGRWWRPAHPTPSSGARSQIGVPARGVGARAGSPGTRGSVSGRESWRKWRTAIAWTDPPGSGAVVPFARPVRRMPDTPALLARGPCGAPAVASGGSHPSRDCGAAWLPAMHRLAVACAARRHAALAKRYFRSQALRMAHNIVENGTVADHIRVLQLLGVLLQNTGDGRLLVFIPGEAEPIWQGPARALPGTAEAFRWKRAGCDIE